MSGGEPDKPWRSFPAIQLPVARISLLNNASGKVVMIKCRACAGRFRQELRPSDRASQEVILRDEAANFHDNLH
jgi:hypothetical protein